MFLLFIGTSLAGIDDGLLAHYPFNSNANDESGNGYNGTVNGAIITEDRFGNPLSAYSFDGFTSYIDIGNGLDFPCRENYAVSVWFLNNGAGPHVNGYGQKIMSKATFFNDFHLAVYTYGHPPPYAGMLYWQQQQGPGGSLSDTSYDYMDNQWHHLVVNRLGSYGEMWVDNVLIGAVNNLTNVCNTRNLYFGFTDHPDFWQRNEGHWNGKIDDIRIYDRVLSEDEVLQLYSTAIEMDIRPKSLNVKSLGVLPVVILGTDELDVNDIDPDSINMEGIAPIQASVDSDENLVLKFNKQEIVAAIGSVDDGDEVVLKLIGEMYDGNAISGKDMVVIIQKGK
jgi:hypothetical protein